MNAIKEIDGPRHGPASGGAARQLVVFLHGWGADGNDLISLAGELARVLPDAAFVSPHGPEPCDMNPMGRQWFGLSNMDMAVMSAGAEAVAPVLDAFLDAELARHDLSDAQLALVGFSQGTMMALHSALRRPQACAAVVGFSGLLVAPDTLEAELVSRPPVLLIHGEMDPVVPFWALGASGEALKNAGVAVETHGRPNLAHGIDQQGFALAAAFLQRQLVS